uniref:Putative secreted protein n=1 Tax=Rhipicephalus microplus TaxID=6941 RepID=A0A6M2DAB3_RHIMP
MFCFFFFFFYTIALTPVRTKESDLPPDMVLLVLRVTAVVLNRHSQYKRTLHTKRVLRNHYTKYTYSQTKPSAFQHNSALHVCWFKSPRP